MTILGISVGTSRTGVCILQEGKLVVARVHDYPAPWSDNKLRIILNRYRKYFDRYGITAVMLKVPPPEKHKGALRRLINRTVALIKEYSCSYDLITKAELKDRLLLRSTDEIIRFAVRAYPQLKPLYNKGLDTNHAYHTKLYESVLSAYLSQMAVTKK